MPWTWAAAAAAALLALAFLLHVLMSKANGRKLPPGPRGIPILGCLHLLGNSPHRDLHQLAKKYGSIMHVRLGLIPTIVVSSPDAAELFLKTHDLAFSSRAPLVAAKYMSYEQRNLTFSPYGSYWRNLRKMCTLELLSTSKISSFKSTRKEELGLLIDKLKEASRGRVPVDLSAKVSSLSADMSCRMVFGKKFADEEFNERGFKSVIEEALQLAAVFNLGDYIPPLAALDLQGLTKKMKAVSMVFDGFLEKIIDEHVQSKDENRTKDFVDVMLEFLGTDAAEYNIDRQSIKALMLDMLAGSTDTSATSIEWALSELIKHPRVMKKVQKELEEKVGKDRMVEESDLDNLEYLDMVVKETFRLHPVVPLLIHAPTEEYNVNGFHIPQNARIIVNVFAITRDPSAWPDADKFWPERFADNEVDLRGRHFQLLPFGSGRRGCPGMQLGLTVLRLVVAQLVHCFDWELPQNMSPEDLDMTEVFSLVTPRATPLNAIPTCRLNI